MSRVFYTIYTVLYSYLVFIYNNKQREEKKREVMESEVTLQRMQMKYKVCVSFYIFIVLNLLIRISRYEICSVMIR